MDVHVETKMAPPFTIEIWYFDTILDIKRRIHKSRGIPVQRQTLFFNGQPLQDDHDTDHYQILHDSRIQLHVSPDVHNHQTTSAAEAAEDHKTHIPPPPLPPANKMIKIIIKTPKQRHQLSVEIDPNDTVLQLKEKIHELEGIHASRLVLQSNGGSELHDNHSLRECNLADNSEITAGIRPAAIVPSGSGLGLATVSAGGSKKLKLLVLTKCGTKKVPVEVNASDSVGELRKELQKLQLPLPQEGYFFIYKQNVMNDDQSFRWHHVNQGDTIEIFNGSVTGGS